MNFEGEEEICFAELVFFLVEWDFVASMIIAEHKIEDKKEVEK